MGKFFRFTINKQLPGKAIKTYLRFWDLDFQENNYKKLLKSLEENCGNKSKVLKGYFCQKGNIIYLLPGSKLDDNSTGQNIVGLRANINTVKAGGKEDFINAEKEVSKDPVTNKALEIFRNNPGEFQGVMTSVTSEDESVKLEITSDYEDCIDDLDAIENFNLNSLFGKSEKEKIEIGEFNPKDVSSAEWVNNCVFAFELGGIKDQNKMVAKMLTKLPSDLLTRVRESLKAEVADDTDKVNVKKFEEILNLLTKKTDAEISSDLERLKFDSSKMTFRDLWRKVENLYRWKLPDLDSDSRNKMVVQSFRSKVPNEIRRNLLFLNSEISDIKLSDLAQKLYDNGNINFEMNYTKMGNRNQGRKYENKGNFSGRKGQNFQGKNQIRCFNCNKLGHKKSECYQIVGFPNNRGINKNNGYRGQQRNNDFANRGDIECHYCRKRGHKADKCFLRLKDLLSQGRRDSRPSYNNQ